MSEGLELKLFVWEKVLEEFGFGKMFALAPDAETARELIIKKFQEPDKDEGISNTFSIEEYRRYKQDPTTVDLTMNNEFYNELSKEPRIVNKPEGFYVWGSS